MNRESYDFDNSSCDLEDDVLGTVLRSGEFFVTSPYDAVELLMLSHFLKSVIGACVPCKVGLFCFGSGMEDGLNFGSSAKEVIIFRKQMLSLPC